MNKTTRTPIAFAALLSVAFLACTGGGGDKGGGPTLPPAKTIADRLDYTNPTGGSFQLVKDTALSAPGGHLVLNLMGPAGTSATGVGFVLSADTTKVTWTKPVASDAILARSTTFDLGTAAPQLGIAKATGDQLQVAFYQKGTTKPAVTLGASTVLASVAVDLKANVPVGSTVTFTAIPGKGVLAQGSGAPAPISITVGTITAN
jgi:hypothetical protein